MMKFRFAAALASLLVGCTSGEPSQNSIVEAGEDIPSLIGLTKAEINARWGTPECPPKNACVYGDKREVFFVNGRAANFTLPPAEDISVYGFTVGSPSFTNTGVKRWDVELAQGPTQISSFENSYVYVMTVEP